MGEEIWTPDDAIQDGELTPGAIKRGLGETIPSMQGIPAPVQPDIEQPNTVLERRDPNEVREI